MENLPLLLNPHGFVIRKDVGGQLSGTCFLRKGNGKVLSPPVPLASDAIWDS